MVLFGYPLETIYLYGFIIATILTVIYIFFGDIFELIFSFGADLYPLLLYYLVSSPCYVGLVI